MQKLDAREAMPVTLGGPTPARRRLFASYGSYGEEVGQTGRHVAAGDLDPVEHEGEDGMPRPPYRKGSGPGVIVIHELPGITPTVIAFAEEVVASGFTVVMPHLFGRPDTPSNTRTIASAMIQVCTASEFTKLATDVVAPIATSLRALARSLHTELGGRGVGAL